MTATLIEISFIAANDDHYGTRSVSRGDGAHVFTVAYDYKDGSQVIAKVASSRADLEASEVEALVPQINQTLDDWFDEDIPFRKVASYDWHPYEE